MGTKAGRTRSTPLPQICRGSRHVKSYRCFFCDEVFRGRHAAWLHFGEENCSSDVPACVDPLRTDEKARMDQIRVLLAEAQNARDELSQMQDWQESYEAVWSELRRYFGDDCSSVWLAGDRYKSALNRIEDLERAAQPKVQADA